VYSRLHLAWAPLLLLVLLISISKDSISKDSISKDSISKDSISKASISSHSACVENNTSFKTAYTSITLEGALAGNLISRSSEILMSLELSSL
jgi:hypothetical protein